MEDNMHDKGMEMDMGELQLIHHMVYVIDEEAERKDREDKEEEEAMDQMGGVNIRGHQQSVSSGDPIAVTTHYPRFEEDNGSLE
jgi:hypothetical protein